MLSQNQIVLFMCFIAYATSQTYTSLRYSDCGSRNVKIDRFTYLPMPILHPGPGKVSVSIAAGEPIKGVIKANLNILRTISGIKLPIKCYKIEGESFGSCAYPDLCALMKRIIKYEPGKCPTNLVQYGIDCECPVNISKRDLDIEMDVEMPQAPTAASWLGSGDFDVKVNATVGNLYACYNIGFAVKAKK